MKTIAWNVDTQYDFMRPDGKLYVQGAEEIEPKLHRLGQLMLLSGWTTVSTGDWHNNESKEISEDPDYVNTFPEHCIMGTEGAQFVKASKPMFPYVIDWQDEKIDIEKLVKKEIVILKDKFDVFEGNPHTGQVLSVLSPDRVLVYGVATNVCVDYAVRGLLQKGLEVYVVEDAIMGLPNIPSPIEQWKKDGVKMILTNEIKDYFNLMKNE